MGSVIIFLLVAVVALSFFGHPISPKVDSSVSTSTQTTKPSSTSTTSISPSTPIWGEYHVNLPNGLMLVDSQGRRSGKDPATGTLYHEIPGTSYGVIGSPTTNGAGELFTTDLPNGQYTLYVLGGATTTYWLDASHYGQSDQIFRGTIQTGSMVAYTQNYDTANLASSTFSFASTVSSTASITSAPPNNLPPPPVAK